MPDIIITLIGYLSAVLLAASLLINQTLKFRWMSAFGCLSFVIYGIMLGSFPVIISNALLLAINIYKIVKLYHLNEVFEFMEIRKDYEIVKRFLNFHHEDIIRYFPDFKFTADEDRICFFVLRDMNIANIFVGKRSSEGSLIVEINYTIPRYRDFKVGKFIFDKEKDFLLSKGISKIVYESVASKNHERFLSRVGFTSADAGVKSCLVKEI
jgi:hypothetical protein